jgi:hypothetical protein
MITALLERMAERHRASHRAARNWGEYPANGAERVRMPIQMAERLSESDQEYDHIVPDSVEVGADEGDSESLATRAIGVSCRLRERVTLDGGSPADASELYDACDVALWEPERANSAGAFLLRGHRGDVQWEVRVVVDQLEGHPIQVALLDAAPPTERNPNNMGLTDAELALIVTLPPMPTMPIPTQVGLTAPAPAPTSMPVPAPAPAQQVAARLVSESCELSQIVRHAYDAGLALALSNLCDDCEEPANGDYEYWGTHDGHGELWAHWRVHLTRDECE